MTAGRNSGVSAPALAGVFFLLLVLAFTVRAAPPAAASPAPASPAASPALVTPGETAGLALLREAGDAWRGGNFRGRLVYVRGNRVESMQVVHAVFDGVEHERISHLDDNAAEIIRRGEETLFVHPGARLTQLDAAAAPFHPFTVIAADLGKVYAVQGRQASRVAGRSADYVEVIPRDTHRYGYRVWLDTASRLPLRYETVGRGGRALESVEFVDLETGIDVPRELFQPPTGVRATLSTRLAQAPLPAVVPAWLPPGFRVTGSRLHQGSDGRAPVSAVTYSDGLATFSFFVEPATADARPAGRQVGPTVAVGGVLDAGRGGRFLVTLVGEVPPGAAVKIVQSARQAAAR